MGDSSNASSSSSGNQSGDSSNVSSSSSGNQSGDSSNTGSLENELKKEEDNLVQEEKKFEDAKKDVEELKLNSINDLDANIIKKQVFFKFKDVTYNPIDSKLMSDYKILTENEYNSLVSTFNLT